MALWRLWWLTILVPALLAGAFDYLRHRVVPRYLYLWPDSVNFITMVLFSALVLSVIVATYMRRHARLMNTARDFASLGETAQGSTENVEPQTMAQRVLPQIVKWLGIDAGAILLLEGDQELLVGTHGVSEGEVYKLLQAFRGTGNRDVDYTWKRDLAGFHCATVIRLRAATSRQGSLLLAARRKPSSHATDIDVLTLLGQQLGGLFENARLNQRVQHLAALDERDRLSREIHDGLAQELGYLNVKLEAVRSMNLPPSLQVELNEMLEVVRNAYMDVREWVGDLRDSRPEELDLAGFLKRSTENFSRRTGITTTLETRGASPPSFSPEVEVQLIRVVQEALANVRKHSRASEALVILEQHGDMARVVVEDNGAGFLASQAFQEGHYGLQTMRERVEGVGGALKVSSYPGMGTRVEALLPTQGREVRVGTH